MSRAYAIGFLLGFQKRAEEADVSDLLEDLELPEGAEEALDAPTIQDIMEQRLPRRIKQPEKWIKSPRSFSSRKRKRFVRQRKLPKSLLSA